MQYSDEFKDLVTSGYYCDLIGQTIRFNNYERICNLLEIGNGNEELGKLLEEGSKLNIYFSPEEILEHLNQLDLNVLRKKAEMAIARKKAYLLWQQKYSVQMQTQQHMDMPTLAELESQRSGR